MSAEPVEASRGWTKTHTFVYEDNGGTPRARKHRYEWTDENGALRKTFRPEHVEVAQLGDERLGYWVPGLSVEDAPPLYRLPQVTEAIEAKAQRIYWCEGERDADALVKAGQVATTSLQSGDDWWSAGAEWFKGYTGTVVVCVDNDDAGAAQALGRRTALRSVGVRTRLVRAPYPQHKDVRDHVEAGHPVDALQRAKLVEVKAAAARYVPGSGGYVPWSRRLIEVGGVGQERTNAAGPSPEDPDAPATPEAGTEREDRINEHLEWLRVQRGARARFDAEHDRLWNVDDEWLSVADLETIPEPVWLIPRYLPSGAVGVVRGRDRSFKSFVVLDWALHLATGKEYHARRLSLSGSAAPTRESVKVLYVVGEGVQSFAARVRAWEAHHGVRAEADNFAIVKRPPNLFVGKHTEQLAALVRRYGYHFVIFDTLSKVAGSADENTIQMRDVMHAVSEIQAATPAREGTALVVHHSQRTDEDSRGHTSIEDGADFVFGVRRATETSMVTRITCSKMKDAPDGWWTDVELVPAGTSLVPVEASRHEAADALMPTSAKEWLPEAFRIFGDQMPPEGWKRNELVEHALAIEGITVQAAALRKAVPNAEREGLIRSNGEASTKRRFFPAEASR